MNVLGAVFNEGSELVHGVARMCVGTMQSVGVLDNMHVFQLNSKTKSRALSKGGFIVRIDHTTARTSAI